MSTDIQQRISCRKLAEVDPLALSSREWLATNGLGGYASGTLSGACTRRYHCLLTAALPAPLGRRVMFNHLAEELKSDGEHTLRLSALDLVDQDIDSCPEGLTEFRLEAGLPVWGYDIGQVKLERRVLLPHLQNSVHVNYQVLSAPGNVRLRLRPSFHFRPHEAPVSSGSLPEYEVTAISRGFEVRDPQLPPLRMCVAAKRTSLVLDGGHRCHVHYRLERERGYKFTGTLWNPGYFRIDLAAGDEATLIASTEPWDVVQGIDPVSVREAELNRRERLLSQSLP